MLTKIPLLTFLIFSVTYPLCFLLSAREPLKNNFHHFHIGLPCVTAGLSVLGMWMLGVSPAVLSIAFVWLLILFTIASFSWEKESVLPFSVVIMTAAGLWVFWITYMEILSTDAAGGLSFILSGLILSAALYAMNLGHWYLNVHGLPLDHLKKATIALGILLAVRLCWDIVMLFSVNTVYREEIMSISRFLFTLDGIFLLVAFFFGTLFPLISIYFVWGTLKAKSTQSATGILYVLLSAILIGDIAYKFYLLNYGLAF
jgi:hypothetical protein